MRTLQTRLKRIEDARRRADTATDAGYAALIRTICRAQLACEPALATVCPGDADPERYRYAQETLAWARGDEAEARRLQAAAPDDGYPGFLAAAGGDHGRAWAAWNNAQVGVPPAEGPGIHRVGDEPGAGGELRSAG